MTNQDWSHLQDVVDALTAAGNTVEPPGFRPTQAGWACQMAMPLDSATAVACVAADPRLAYKDDELSCSHCWAVISGQDAKARYAAAHRAHTLASRELAEDNEP